MSGGDFRDPGENDLGEIDESLAKLRKEIEKNPGALGAAMYKRAIEMLESLREDITGPRWGAPMNEPAEPLVSVGLALHLIQKALGHVFQVPYDERDEPLANLLLGAVKRLHEARSALEGAP